MQQPESDPRLEGLGICAAAVGETGVGGLQNLLDRCS